MVSMATIIRFIALSFLMAPGIGLAAGTVGLADIDPLLKQKPEIRNYLMSTLDMDSTVMAAVRFGSHVKHLGGARMGPYIIQARPKTPKNAAPLEVVLCTDARFFDESGNTTEDEANAARLEEKLTVVMLRAAGSAPAIPGCP
jgi:Ran GTPase-activating protein (RanGAP) involved in mRNA processing and transport